eukprot:5069319-Amphidinium_carterae.1
MAEASSSLTSVVLVIVFEPQIQRSPHTKVTPLRGSEIRQESGGKLPADAMCAEFAMEASEWTKGERERGNLLTNRATAP